MSENLTNLKQKINISEQNISEISQENITDINNICKKINKDKIQKLLETNPKIKLNLDLIFKHYSNIFVKNGFSIEEVNDSDLRSTLTNIVNPMIAFESKSKRINDVLNLI